MEPAREEGAPAGSLYAEGPREDHMLAHAIALALFAIPSIGGQPPRFRAVPLESSGGNADIAWDINERGVAVGEVNNKEGPLTAACWDPAGNLTVLGRK